MKGNDKVAAGKLQGDTLPFVDPPHEGYMPPKTIIQSIFFRISVMKLLNFGPE